MAGRAQDLTGQRFLKLVALERAGFREGKKCRKSLWKCRCDCGNEAIVASVELVSGGTRSCGCLVGKHKRTHGGTGTPEYRVWDAMRRRCGDPKNTNYPSYGGRGITVCEQWQDFAVFLADMGPRPRGSSIDRIDNDGNYEPGNCRWATPTVQSNNRRSSRPLTLSGETLTAAQWERRLGLRTGLVSRRLSMGWTVEQSLARVTRQYGVFTVEQVHECRTSGLSDAHLARRWRVTSQAVRHARMGRTYKEVPTPPDLRRRFPGGRYTTNEACFERAANNGEAQP